MTMYYDRRLPEPLLRLLADPRTRCSFMSRATSSCAKLSSRARWYGRMRSASTGWCCSTVCPPETGLCGRPCPEGSLHTASRSTRSGAGCCLAGRCGMSASTRPPWSQRHRSLRSGTAVGRRNRPRGQDSYLLEADQGVPGGQIGSSIDLVPPTRRRDELQRPVNPPWGPRTHVQEHIGDGLGDVIDREGSLSA